MKKLFLLVNLLILVSSGIKSQSKLSLSKQEMYADFDSLISSIRHNSPHLYIKKDLWNYDALAALNAQRMCIDTISSDFSYYLLLRRVFNLTLDMHTSILGGEDWSNTMLSEYNRVRSAFKFSLGNVYVDGKYRISNPVVCGKDTIPMGAVITHIHGIPVNEYVKKNLGSRYGYAYDAAYQNFYFTGFFKDDNSIFMDSLRFVIEQDGKKKKYSFSTKNFTQFLPSKSTNKSDTARIAFWQPEQILYIRVPAMDANKIPFFSEGIRSYRDKAGDIKKVILDFRGNPGGEDTVWMSMFSELIPNNIRFQLKLDDRDSSSINKPILAGHGMPQKPLRPETNPVLRNYGFNVIVENTDSLTVSATSIRFPGKIYVLYEDNYSAASSSLTIVNASMEDNLVSIGRPSDYFLGMGLSPIQFVLPNTKLRYRIAPSIDATNVVELRDILHNRLEIEVPKTMQEAIDRFNYPGDLLEKNFLLNYDPVIREILTRK
ncbi:MAG: S41 family peptidase [Ferruginibacter sp.]